MASVFEYEIDLVGSAESDDTLINKLNIRVIDCSVPPQDENLCNLWNYSHCPSDVAYRNPFVEGDKIYVQDVYFVGQGEPPTPELINTDNGQVITQGGTDPLITVNYVDSGAPNYTQYRNITIDTAQIPSNITCFYMRIAKGGGYIYSEPYIKVKCENTIYLKGYYPKFDCRNHYYGDPSYKAEIRIVGEVLPSAFDIEEQVINKKRTSTKTQEQFILMSKRLPYYVIQKIVDIFASQIVTIDGIEYERTLSISKNLERGKMWVINTTIVKTCDEINFSCD